MGRREVAVTTLRWRSLVFAVAAAAGLALGGPAVAQEKLTVWWAKGFYKSEDDALLQAVKKFEQKTGVTVDLSQYPVQDMIPKTVSALDAGTPPDVGYADVYDFQVTGKWAFDGKLEDISDVLATAGFQESDIPATWKEYWSFWCDKAQPAYRKKTGTRVFGIGQPMGVDSSDSFYSFLTFVDAYNVKLVDDEGKLTLDG